MSQNIQIACSGLSLTDAMRSAIEAQVEKLKKSAGTSHVLHNCHVHVDRPGGGASLPHLFNVRLRITIDDKELVANNHQHPDFYVALRHAFDVLQRQIRTIRDARTAAALHDTKISAHLETDV